jgi:hypothetical protein
MAQMSPQLPGFTIPPGWPSSDWQTANGDLFIWSPTALTPTLRNSVDAIGRVWHIVAPNSLHHLFLLDWAGAYPGATVYLAARLSEKRRDILYYEVLGAMPAPEWAGEIDQALMLGNQITTEMVVFHRQSSTVIFTYLLQQHPANWFMGWREFIAKLDLIIGSEAAIPRKFRMTFLDPDAARAAVAQILAWPIKTVLMAHGQPVKSDAAAFLRRAFAWLSR